MILYLAVWGGLTLLCVVAGIVKTSMRPVLVGSKIVSKDYADYEAALAVERIFWVTALIVGVVGACAMPILGIILGW